MVNRICSINGCNRPHKAHGLCGAHYYRLRTHGDPLAGGVSHGTLRRYVEETVFNYTGEDCLRWPFGHAGNGYAKLNTGGRMQYVHRLACEHKNGPPPTQKHEAAHTCGKGHLGCVNPRHLTWKTRAENMADRVAHGTIVRGEHQWKAKLTKADVLQIISLRGVATQAEIARRFGVDPSSISQIYSGRNWGWLNDTGGA